METFITFYLWGCVFATIINFFDIVIVIARSSGEMRTDREYIIHATIGSLMLIVSSWIGFVCVFKNFLRTIKQNNK